MADRVSELEARIRHHQDLYYNGEPEISDREFDALWDELQRIAPDSAVLRLVGRDASVSFEKRRHVIPMTSQDKAANPEAFFKWAAKVDHSIYIVQFKMDGAGLELQYENGELAHGVTRGDGVVGDDITPNVRKMQGVRHHVGGEFTGAVRGEVVMSRSMYAKKYSDKANCRNAANGIMKRKDGAGNEDLDVIVYDAIASESIQIFEDELTKLRWLKYQGFTVIQYTTLAHPRGSCSLPRSDHGDAG